MKRAGALVAGLVVAVSLGTTAAFGVKFGEPDNGRHPSVGLMVAYDASWTPLWRCTGSLIDADTVLLAAHCTEAPAAHAAMWFDEDVTAVTHPAYPSPLDADATGTPIPHPGWNGALTIPNTHDVGVVQLDAPLPGPYGALAPAGYLDELATRRGTQNVEFVVTGYGRQSVKPRLSTIRVRQTGTVTLVNLRSNLTDGYNVQTSNDPGLGHGGSGGTCFGDSGGPVLHFDGTREVIVGVNSFVMNLNCNGSSFAYRVDIADARSFLAGYTAVP